MQQALLVLVVICLIPVVYTSSDYCSAPCNDQGTTPCCDSKCEEPWIVSQCGYTYGTHQCKNQGSICVEVKLNNGTECYCNCLGVPPPPPPTCTVPCAATSSVVCSSLPVYDITSTFCPCSPIVACSQDTCNSLVSNDDSEECLFVTEQNEGSCAPKGAACFCPAIPPPTTIYCVENILTTSDSSGEWWYDMCSYCFYDDQPPSGVQCDNCHELGLKIPGACSYCWTISDHATQCFCPCMPTNYNN